MKKKCYLCMEEKITTWQQLKGKGICDECSEKYYGKMNPKRKYVKRKGLNYCYSCDWEVET